MASESPNQPESSIRLGNVSASIFRNQAESGQEFRSVVFQRSYRTSSGEWKFSSSFNVADIPTLERVMKLAQEQTEKLEGVVDGSAQQ